MIVGLGQEKSLVYTAAFNKCVSFGKTGGKMGNKSVPKELLEARDQIDQIDRNLVELLAERFKLTHQVGVFKADQELNALDESREAEKLEELRRLCSDKGLNPELVTELFRRIMEEVVKNHKKLRQ